MGMEHLRSNSRFGSAPRFISDTKPGVDQKCLACLMTLLQYVQHWQPFAYGLIVTSVDMHCTRRS